MSAAPIRHDLQVDARPFLRELRRAMAAMVMDDAHRAALEEDQARRWRKVRRLVAACAFLLAALEYPHLSDAGRAIGTAGAVLVLGVYAAVRLALNAPGGRRRRAS